MKPVLYAHPFSSYCQKVLLALEELGTEYETRQLGGNPAVDAEFAALWPIRRMPLLVDGPRTLRESTIIIEYLHLKAGAGSALLPADPLAALDVRFYDRFFDNYVMTPMQRIVFTAIRKVEDRDQLATSEAIALLEKAYTWLDAQLGTKSGPWLFGSAFTMADCAAMPSLFYADWVHRIDHRWPHVAAYRARLLARPTVVQVVDAARPFRSYFPHGAPDRD